MPDITPTNAAAISRALHKHAGIITVPLNGPNPGWSTAAGALKGEVVVYANFGLTSDHDARKAEIAAAALEEVGYAIDRGQIGDGMVRILGRTS
ncbi:hypothetical protein GS896_25540 [Rhodococcus hoagii]|nr:hypothetical protein [Prescottella equi]MBM4654130.1 hypothetical protein [Prescottella equi]MBM4719604.1 hypothetical protein [Prescottella equi]NKR23402.1 hypothetical protein [Prescottella equi]NKT55986.1 hypothetical protein [Prescottella equi]